MTSGTTGFAESRGWPRRALAGLGSATIGSARLLLLFVSFVTTILVIALRRASWRGAPLAEFKRVLHEVSFRSLPTVFATAVLVGFALVSQAVYWLAQTGTTDQVGPIIVSLLVRELVPIMVGLIIFGRNGTATLIELGEARIKGSLRLFEIQGLDPMVLLVVPRAFGFAVGAFCQATVLLLATLSTGYLMAQALGLVAYSIQDFASLVLRALTVRDFIVPPLKCVVIGFMVAATCCATGLGRRDETEDLQRLVPRGFVRSALAILAVNSLFSLS